MSYDCMTPFGMVGYSKISGVSTGTLMVPRFLGDTYGGNKFFSSSLSSTSGDDGGGGTRSALQALGIDCYEARGSREVCTRGGSGCENLGSR